MFSAMGFAVITVVGVALNAFSKAFLAPVPEKRVDDGLESVIVRAQHRSRPGYRPSWRVPLVRRKA